ncbi:MAG TPA: hypothetical protein VFW35_02265 [Sphingomicrobium sp.]|nr:hypothetical protein [Sphingomicrobium sp.]
MSLSASAISELPLAAQPASTSTTTSRPPRKRLLTAKADLVQQPEAR